MFPLIVYLLFFCYSKSDGNDSNYMFLDVALYTSLYLSMKYGVYYVGDIPLTFFNIPLLVAYLKKRKMSALFMSVVIVIYYVMILKYHIILVLLEYVLYYLLYIGIQKAHSSCEKTINIFVLIKGFFLACQTFLFADAGWHSYLEIVITIVLFYFLSYVVLRLFEKSEDIVDLNVAIKELEHEKQIKTSLFKITHEIKNPIAVCKGYLDMFDVNNPKHAVKYVPIMKQEIDTTLNIMEDFLDFTKINLEFELLDINMFLDDVCSSFENLVKGNHIAYHYDISDDEDYVMGDYNRLKQVFINVIKNSVEAICEDGEIHIFTKKQDGMISIMVQDNGIGMDDEQLKRFDELFYTTKQRGTGLGVSLSKEIIKRHKGTIVYDSKKNEGTTVTITLPLEETSEL